MNITVFLGYKFIQYYLLNNNSEAFGVWIEFSWTNWSPAVPWSSILWCFKSQQDPGCIRPRLSALFCLVWNMTVKKENLRIPWGKKKTTKNIVIWSTDWFPTFFLWLWEGMETERNFSFFFLPYSKATKNFPVGQVFCSYSVCDHCPVLFLLSLSFNADYLMSLLSFWLCQPFHHSQSDPVYLKVWTLLAA